MRAGEEITEECIRCIRPGYGLPPKFFKAIIGRKVVNDVIKGTRTSWELVKD